MEGLIPHTVSTESHASTLAFLRRILPCKPTERRSLRGWGAPISSTSCGIIANGTIDHSFGSNGTANCAVAGCEFDSLCRVLIQSDGKILVMGTTVGSPHRINLMRFNSDGTLDTTFNGVGYVRAAFNVTDINDCLLQSDGRIVLVGSIAGASGQDIAVVRFTSEGTLDTSFASDGIGTFDLGGGDDYGFAVTIDSNGNIVVGGRAYKDAASGTRGVLIRLLPDGSLDRSFNQSGCLFSSASRHSEDRHRVGRGHFRFG